MKASDWNTYRTRFLVKAKQLSFDLSFTDALGRLHAGCKGDYLVESSDGVLSITPRRIFEDVYVPMTPSEEVETLPVGDGGRGVRRKLPQAWRDRRPTGPLLS
jgi:hypothetical protein